MNLNLKKLGSTVIIYLEGRLDVHLSADIEKEINKLIDMNLKAASF